MSSRRWTTSARCRRNIPAGCWRARAPSGYRRRSNARSAGARAAADKGGAIMKGFLRTLLLTIGVLATLLGVWWICQGTGLVPIGFMANHMTWAYRGMGLVAGGIVIAILSR